MDRREFIRTTLLVSIAASGLAGCARSNSNRRIGLLLSVTGPADFIGKPERAVAEKLKKDLSDRGLPIPDFDVRDTGTEVAQAETLFEQIAQDDSYIAVIGPSTSGESIAVAELTDRYRIPVLSLAASRKIVEREGSTEARRWVFKFAQNDDLAAKRLLGGISNVEDLQRTSRLAFLYSDDGFGRSGAEVFSEAVSSFGGLSVTTERSFPKDLVNPRAIVSGLPDIDAVVVWGTAPGPALLVREFRASRPRTNIYLSHGNASFDFLESTGPSAEGTHLVGSRSLLLPNELDAKLEGDAAVLRFQEFWKANFEGQPNHFGGHAYDAIELLASILRSEPEILNKDDVGDVRSTVRDRIEETVEFNGATGNFSFSPQDHAGLSLDSFAFLKVQGGQFKRA